MKAYRINYSETYSRNYLVKAKSKEEAIRLLSNAMMEGKVDAPDECDASNYDYIDQMECRVNDIDVMEGE